MEMKILSDRKDELKFELTGEGHGFSRLLVHELLKDKNVELAQYVIPHPQVGQPTFNIKMKKGDPSEAVTKAAKAIKKNVKDLMSK